MAPMTILLLLFIFHGTVLIGLSIPLSLDRVPPNSWYGLRVRRTLENPDVWYPANRYSGRLGLGLGVVVILSAIGLYWVPGITFEAYAWTFLGVVMVGLAALLFMVFRYLQTLPR